jgi:hypothetical protein
MTPECIHGFIPEHCAACRTCPHGITTSRCGRCAAAATARQSAKAVVAEQPSEDYQGHEIFFVPIERSWYFGATDGVRSRESYPSAFRARRAITEALAAGPEKSRQKAKRH